MKRILVALDSPRESRLVEAAVAAASEGCTLITVISAAPPPSAWIGYPWGAPPMSPELLRRDALRAAERTLAWAREVVPSDLHVTTRIVDHCGSRRALVLEARSGRHDVVVLAAPGTGVLRRFAARWQRARLARCGVSLVEA